MSNPPARDITGTTDSLQTSTTESIRMTEPDHDPMWAAQRHLELLAHLAGEADQWQERSVFTALADVADYTRRICLPTASDHYRAEKAGSLLRAAIRTHRQTLLGYAGWPDGTVVEREIDHAHELLQEVADGVSVAAWTAAKGGHLYDESAAALVRTVRELLRWAERLASEAVPYDA